MLIRLTLSHLICAIVALGAFPISAQTNFNDELASANFCEALSVGAFHVAELSTDQLEKIGLSRIDMAVDEINALPDEEYQAWWSSVLNKATVTHQYNAGETVQSRVVNLAALATVQNEAHRHVRETCPEAAHGSNAAHLLTAWAKVEIGIFPEGIDPVSTQTNFHLVGLPYDANGEVDITHEFWTVPLNLVGLGLPIREDGRVDQTKLDVENLIHVAWSEAWHHQRQAEREQRLAEAERRSAEIRAAAIVACELLAIAKNLEPDCER